MLNTGGKFYASQFVPELGFNGDSDWDKAKLRVIFCFPCSPAERLIASTHTVLYNIVKQTFGDDVFVDIAMEPLDVVNSYYKKSGLPIWYGQFSKREITDFDMVGLSIAIVKDEFAGTFQNLLDLKFPIFHKDRIHNGKYPFLFMGGIAADNSASLDEVVDLVCLGLGERTIPTLLTEALAIKSRTGSVNKDKMELIDAVKNQPGFYYPSAYHYDYEVKDGVLQHLYKGHDAGFPDEVKPDVSLPIDKYGWSEDIQRPFPQCLNQRRANILMSIGCSGCGVCSFCHEGNLYGAWRERSIEDLDKAMEVAKRSAMGETVSYYSFNSNYHSSFSEALSLSYKYFDRLSVINFRVDTLAHEPDFINLMKALGANGISMAVEGWGENIRNNLFNKNLLFDEIKTASERVFQLRMMRLKVGMVESGYETKEDFEEGFDEIRQLVALREKHLAGTKLQINVTALVHYYGTPLFVYPRVMPYYSWLDWYDGSLYHYPYQVISDMGVVIKRGTDKGKHFFQQLVMDFGRKARDIAFEPMLRGIGLKDPKYNAELAKNMKAIGLDPKNTFLNPAVENHASQHVTLSANQKLYSKLQYTKRPVNLCIVTSATLGRAEKISCKGCHSCEDIDETAKELGLVRPPHKEWLLKRKLAPIGSVMKIKEMKMKNAPNFLTRFYVQYLEPGRFISKENLNRKILVKLQEMIPSFFSNYRRTSSSGAEKLDCEAFPSAYAGLDVYTIYTQTKIDITQEMILKVNASLEGVKLLKVEEVHNQSQSDLLYLFRLTTVFSLENANKYFNKFLETKVFKLYSSNTQMFKEIKTPFYFKTMMKDGAYQMFFLMKAKVNPMFIFSDSLSVVKTLEKVKMDVVSLLTKKVDALHTDVLSGKDIDFSYFTYVDIGEDEDDLFEEVIEIDGH